MARARVLVLRDRARIRRAHRGGRGEHVDEADVRRGEARVPALGRPEAPQRRLVLDRGCEHAVEVVRARAGREAREAFEERARFGALLAVSVLAHRSAESEVYSDGASCKSRCEACQPGAMIPVVLYACQIKARLRQRPTASRLHLILDYRMHHHHLHA
jgi:hypothetical protein